MSALQQLRTMTTIVADTGDLAAIARLKPIDATTNPSLITKAMTQPDNQSMLSETMSRHHGDVDAVIDALTIQVGCDILALIEGRVSTEVDARLSYDTGATIGLRRAMAARSPVSATMVVIVRNCCNALIRCPFSYS